jgi:NAD(P)-dependent dehydrogenase (short-subunit alcohol dehydrogenase family)
MAQRKVAFVTGASRGIGRACARQLAVRGFDVAVAARTINEGDARGGLPGSLAAVANDIEEAGGAALQCRLDLLDPESCEQAVAQAMEQFGRIDVLVNSGILTEGGMKSFVDTPMDHFERAFTANVIAPLRLIKLVLPSMQANGGGTIINISSGAGQNETRALPGAGGWPLSYSLTKAAFNRAATGLGKELRDEHIAVINLEPGVVATERMQMFTAKMGIEGAANGVDVDVPGTVCAYLAAHSTPMAFSGRTVDAPQFCVWAGLLDGTQLPYPYGPTAWGAPPASSIAGLASGVETGVKSGDAPD